MGEMGKPQPLMLYFLQTKGPTPQRIFQKTEEGRTFMLDALRACLTDTRAPKDWAPKMPGNEILVHQNIQDVLTRPGKHARFPRPPDFGGFVFEKSGAPLLVLPQSDGGWKLQVGEQGLKLLSCWADQDPDSFKEGAAFLLQWIDALRHVPSKDPPEAFARAMAMESKPVIPLAKRLGKMRDLQKEIKAQSDAAPPDTPFLRWKALTRDKFTDMIEEFSSDKNTDTKGPDKPLPRHQGQTPEFTPGESERQKYNSKGFYAAAAGLLFFRVLSEGNRAVEHSDAHCVSVQFVKSWSKGFDDTPLSSAGTLILDEIAWLNKRIFSILEVQEPVFSK